MRFRQADSCPVVGQLHLTSIAQKCTPVNTAKHEHFSKFHSCRHSCSLDATAHPERETVSTSSVLEAVPCLAVDLCLKNSSLAGREDHVAGRLPPFHCLPLAQPWATGAAACVIAG